jgi:hypothetical protein
VTQKRGEPKKKPEKTRYNIRVLDSSRLYVYVHRHNMRVYIYIYIGNNMCIYRTRIIILIFFSHPDDDDDDDGGIAL